MKFCKKCEGPSGSCCDFCKHYAFNADAGGFYVGMGFCAFHDRPEDPGSLCDDFYCDNVGFEDEDRENDL